MWRCCWRKIVRGRIVNPLLPAVSEVWDFERLARHLSISGLSDLYSPGIVGLHGSNALGVAIIKPVKSWPRTGSAAMAACLASLECTLHIVISLSHLLPSGNT